ncbi:MAG: hypothetical protein ACJAYM_000756 [Flavobacteriales bacterium]
MDAQNSDVLTLALVTSALRLIAKMDLVWLLVVLTLLPATLTLLLDAMMDLASYLYTTFQLISVRHPLSQWCSFALVVNQQTTS